MDEPASPPSAGRGPDEEPVATVADPAAVEPAEGDGPDEGHDLILGLEGQLTFSRGGGAT